MPSCLYFLDHYLIAKMSLFLSTNVLSIFWVPSCFCYVYFFIAKLFLFLSVLCVPCCLFYVYSFISKLLLCIFFDCQVVFVLFILWLPNCLCFVYSLSANLFLFSLFPDCQAGFVFLSDLCRSLIFPSIAFFSRYIFSRFAYSNRRLNVSKLGHQLLSIVFYTFFF
jgi:hypothetical protein